MSLSLLLAAALAASSDPVSSQAINQAYKSLADARQAGDVEGMASAFAADSLLIDSRPAPAMRGAALAGQLKPMVERLKQDSVTVRTLYRVEERTIVGDTAVDAGFANMVFQVKTPVEGKPIPRDMIRRFMVTWKRDQGGKWSIIGDASFPATQAQWDAATPKPGLYFE